MVDFARFHLIGQLMLDPSNRPHTVEPVPTVRTGAPQGVYFDLHPIFQPPSEIHISRPPQPRRSRHLMEWGFGFGMASPQENFEFHPFSTNYRTMSPSLAYYHAAWGYGKRWEGSLGVAFRGSFVFGDYHNNGSSISGAYLCAAARQSARIFPRYLNVSATVYACPGILYSELNFGRSAEHRQPVPSMDFNVWFGARATVYFGQQEYFPGIFVETGVAINLSQTAQIAGTTPTAYRDPSLLVGLSLALDPVPKEAEIPPELLDATAAQATAREWRDNYENLYGVVQDGMRTQPTQADYSALVDQLNQRDQALCQASHSETLWRNNRPPAPRYRFQFVPNTSNIDLRLVRAYRNRGGLQGRNAILDNIASEIRHTPEGVYFIVDAYAVDQDSQDHTTSVRRLDAVRVYFETHHHELLPRLIFDSQSAHGHDLPALNEERGIDPHYYLNDAVTFTPSGVDHRSQCECIEIPDTSSNIPGRTHTEYQCP